MSRYGLSLIRVTSSLDGCVVAVFFLCCWCSLVGEVVRRSQLWCTRRKESFWPLIRNSFPNLHSTLILQHGVRTQKTPLISQEPTAASKQPRPLRPLPSSSQALNFGNGHGHKMEEIGLKSTHKIRAILVTLFFTSQPPKKPKWKIRFLLLSLLLNVQMSFKTVYFRVNLWSIPAVLWIGNYLSLLLATTQYSPLFMKMTINVGKSTLVILA